MQALIVGGPGREARIEASEDVSPVSKSGRQLPFFNSNCRHKLPEVALVNLLAFAEAIDEPPLEALTLAGKGPQTSFEQSALLRVAWQPARRGRSPLGAAPFLLVEHFCWLSLLEGEDSIPVVLHADDRPALSSCFFDCLFST
jgi:hypothetical protein